jgi:ATP-binding cassette subfamily B protein
VVERLPRGLESHIKEKGVNLSGGEKQRLAIARGLIASRDKEIVMMDEPTSSVDSKNELEIYRNIFRKFRDKTIISSVHRLHMLKLFDKIYVFDNGRIVASGTFERLKQKSPEFRELLKKYAVKRKASR